MNPNQYAKAIAGAILSGLGAYQVALLSPGITAGEWVGVAIAFVTALGGVWAVTNAPQTPVAGETVKKPLHVEVQ